MATTAPANPAHLLDLHSEERQHIRIDGHPYALKTSHDLSFRQWRLFAGAYNRIIALENGPLTEADDIELLEQLAAAIRLVAVDLPAEVLAKLGYAARSAIIATFVKLSGSGLSFLRAVRAEATTEATPSPGTPSSPGSPASTAAAPTSGKTTSRSGTSTRRTRK